MAPPCAIHGVEWRLWLCWFLGALWGVTVAEPRDSGSSGSPCLRGLEVPGDKGKCHPPPACCPHRGTGGGPGTVTEGKDRRGRAAGG